MDIRRTPATFLLHAAMAVIVAGALITHFFGIEGRLHLTVGEAPVSVFEKTSETGEGILPFEIALVEPVIYYYPGTTTPMDYASRLRLTRRGELLAENVTAMNKVMSCRGWRFFQSGISDNSSTLLVSHDPVGTAVTYVGYGLAVVAMLLFFFQKRSLWRAACRRVLVVFLFLSTAVTSFASAEMPRTLQAPLADRMGHMYVLWNGRICPVQTMARDISVKLYGTRSYLGMSAEQVLAGWLFYYDDWMENLMATGDDEEKLRLARWVGSGAAFRIYPYETARGTVEWLSLSEHRPSCMSLEQWIFMQTSMPKVASLVASGRNTEAYDKLAEIIAGQRRYAPPGILPSDTALKLEIWYNDYVRLMPVAVLLIVLAFAGIFVSVSSAASRRERIARTVLNVCVVASSFYVLSALFVHSYVGRHLPFGNGFETMLSLSVIALLACMIAGRGLLMKSAIVLVGALALFVAVMGDKNPQIAHLVPVLVSPWLSVHVMLVILSYALFALMSVLAAVSLIASDKEVSSRCADMDRVLLLPAVFLLGAGIMAGAVWANHSWGRYWGWDPKETCALVTLLVYAAPLHARTLKVFRRQKPFSVYILLAILAVLFTYFGANYFLPGLHSYA